MTVQQFFAYIGAWLNFLYLQSPNRVWIWLLTVGVLMILNKPTRRAGTVGIIVLLGCWGVATALISVFQQYTPH